MSKSNMWNTVVGVILGSQLEYKDKRELIDFVRKAESDQEARDDPQPLTIDELKGMIGEPVWVQGPGIPQYGRWAIVEDAVGNSLILVNDFTCHDIGKVWLAYRHKPKEEAQ